MRIRVTGMMERDLDLIVVISQKYLMPMTNARKQQRYSLGTAYPSQEIEQQAEITDKPPFIHRLCKIPKTMANKFSDSSNPVAMVIKQLIFFTNYQNWPASQGPAAERPDQCSRQIIRLALKRATLGKRIYEQGCAACRQLAPWALTILIRVIPLAAIDGIVGHPANEGQPQHPRQSGTMAEAAKSTDADPHGFMAGTGLVPVGAK